MGEPKKDKQIQMKLIKIMETGFQLNPVIDSITDLDNVIIQVGFKVDTPSIKNTITLWLQVKYLNSKSLNEQVIAEIETATTFELTPLEAALHFQKEQFEDQAGILPSLLNIAIGTIRGILHIKLAGTILGSLPLPILNAEELCKHTNIKASNHEEQ